jgi:hypothetical protein
MAVRARRLTSEQVELLDYQSVQEHFWSEGWTDGLPVVPPTEELVEIYLDMAGIEPHQVVGVLPERGREITAEKVAINAVMAGCLPEYFPIVLAAWQAVCAPEWNLNSGALSTSGPAPLIIVNGPVARQIGMRSGQNLFGPGNRANATIGRAMRLMLINLAGAAGDLDKACTGHPGKYSFCIAEDEEEGVPGWEPLHVRRGFESGQSAVTVVNLEAPQHVRDEFSATPEQMLANFCDHIRTWNQAGAGVVVMNPEHRQVLKDAGWSKADVARYLFEHSGRSYAEMKRASRLKGAVEPSDEERMFRWARSPEDFIVVGGGAPGVFSAVIPPWGGGVWSDPVTTLVPELGCAGECFI